MESFDSREPAAADCACCSHYSAGPHATAPVQLSSDDLNGQFVHSIYINGALLPHYAARRLPAMPSSSVDTVIVGSGPAAMILSYILHGYIPYYRRTESPHPDALLDVKLPSDLTRVNADGLAAYFEASRISYSTAALPINVLLDTLLRPLADTEPGVHASCVEWRFQPQRAVTHCVIGETAPGGVWAAPNAVPGAEDISALSYVDQLSLPGYTLAEHLAKSGQALQMECWRPTRRQVAEYLAEYPTAVNISDSIAAISRVSGIRRTDGGFYIESHQVQCRYLVLASGIFSSFIPPGPALRSLLRLPACDTAEAPLLVVGSGFTAADVIITELPKHRILHVFHWDPENRPSPLRACHKSAYPDYAGVYRRMKKAAISTLGEAPFRPPLLRQNTNMSTLESRGLDARYEALPNAQIEGASVDSSMGRVKLKLHDGSIEEREVSGLRYVVGRRGSLRYLDEALCSEILGADLPDAESIKGSTLREQVAQDPEVAPGVFVIGSLAGDSLIRFAYGTCVSAAGRIIMRRQVEDLDRHGATAAAATHGDDNSQASSKSRCQMTAKSTAVRSDGEPVIGARRLLESIISDKCILQ